MTIYDHLPPDIVASILGCRLGEGWDFMWLLLAWVVQMLKLFKIAYNVIKAAQLTFYPMGLKRRRPAVSGRPLLGREVYNIL